MYLAILLQVNVCSKAEAAKLAGYSPDRCRREGSELTNPRYSPLVVKYIGELRAGN